MRNYIGTSGWMYKPWIGDFYPDGTKQSKLFDYYKTQFDTVELNTTFYHLPLEKTIKNWLAKAPADFVYAVKASRYIIHQKRLLEPKESWKSFIDRVKPLGRALGPILFQTPPSLRIDLDRLEALFKILPKKYRYTFEFRHPTWFVEETYKLLKKYNAALCIYDLGGFTSPRVMTADFTYIRLHGPKYKYRGSYTDEQLEVWAEFIRKHNKQGCDSYCYFDNDMGGHAPWNALTLRKFLD